MTTTHGGPPSHEATTPDQTLPIGLTLRDWFAGQALTGFLASHCSSEDAPVEQAEHIWEAPDFASQIAFKMADAMLRARQK